MSRRVGSGRGRRAALLHDLGRRPGAGRAPSAAATPWSPGRPAAWWASRDTAGRARPAGAGLRHGRHLHRRLPLRRRAGAARHGRGRRRSAAQPDAGRRDRGGGRRLDPRLRRPARPGRPRQRRRRSRARLLRPRRPGHRDRRQPGARPARPARLPGGVRPRRRPAAGRRRPPAPAAELAAAMGAASLRGRRRGLPRVAVEQMAQARAAHLHRARLRPARTRPDRLRRRAGQVACATRRGPGGGARSSARAQGSVLSAWGIGEARVERAAQAGLEAPLDAARPCGGPGAAADGGGGRRARRWPSRARAERGPPHALRLHYDDADAELPVAPGDAAAARAAFEAAHQRLFGFVEPERPILIAAVEVEALSELRLPRESGGRRFRFCRSGQPKSLDPRFRGTSASGVRGRRLA